MRVKKYLGASAAGLSAGLVNGLFGAGGGMLLVPLLGMWTPLREDEVFPASVSVIAPVCLISLAFSVSQADFSWRGSLPYLLGSAIGGIGAGLWGKKISVKWLHRLLGALILWGGIRYLC